MWRDFALFLHVGGVVIWVGGMFFAHMALRPAVQSLPVEMRLPLLENALSRFLNWAGLSAIVILLSGFAMWGRVKPSEAPLGWLVMMATGLLMMAIYGHLRFAAFKKFRMAVMAADWSDAAQRLALVRKIVLINLSLGLIVIAAVYLLK
jgi:uncharacterized membrane protein